MSGVSLKAIFVVISIFALSSCAMRPLNLEQVETMPFIPFTGQASLVRGQQLFESKTLGDSINDKRCYSCHEDGEGLNIAIGKSYDAFFGYIVRDLKDMANLCIALPLKGKPYLKESQEMADLIAYLYTFERSQAVQ